MVDLTKKKTLAEYETGAFADGDTVVTYRSTNAVGEKVFRGDIVAGTAASIADGTSTALKMYSDKALKDAVNTGAIPVGTDTEIETGTDTTAKLYAPDQLNSAINSLIETAVPDGTEAQIITGTDTTERKFTPADINGAVKDIAVAQYAGRTAMKAATGLTAGDVVYLSEGGRSGTFEYLVGDYSAEVAADTLEGVYVELDGVDASVGVLKRVYNDLYPEFFGATGDCVFIRGDAGSVSGTDDTIAYKAYLSFITRVETASGFNPNANSGGRWLGMDGAKYRITEKITLLSDNLTAVEGNWWLVLDHNESVGIQIGEAGKIPIRNDYTDLKIASYQSSGTVVDVLEAIYLEMRPRIETHGGATNTVNGLTIHSGQHLKIKNHNITVYGVPIVFDLDYVSDGNGLHLFDHIYVDDGIISGKMVGKTTDETGCILWLYYADIAKSTRTARINENHFVGNGVTTTSAIKFRGYDTKGGTLLTSNYNPCYNLYLGGGNWSENVGGIIDYHYARNMVDLDNWTHEPNVNGGTMLSGNSANAVFNVGSIALRGGSPAYLVNSNGRLTFNKDMAFTSNPTSVFGPLVSSGKCSFTRESIGNSDVKYSDDVTVSIGNTSVDIVHGLELGSPDRFSAIPDWDTTVRFQNVNSTTVRFHFGTAPTGSDGSLFVFLESGV